MAEVTFVVHPIAWQQAFQSWTGSPVGTWLWKKTEEVEVATRLEAPGPGKPPRNRTGINYATGQLESAITSTRRRADTGRDLESHVIALPEHAKFVEFGTAPHQIWPRKPGGVLRFRRGASIVYASHVNHPGTMANDFMMRGLRRGMPGILA